MYTWSTQPLKNISSKGTSTQKIVPSNGGIISYQIEITPNNSVVGEIHEKVKLLVEHMDIIEDSRMQVRDGNITTWDEFKKIYSKKKK